MAPPIVHVRFRFCRCLGQDCLDWAAFTYVNGRRKHVDIGFGGAVQYWWPKPEYLLSPAVAVARAVPPQAAANLCPGLPLPPDFITLSMPSLSSLPPRFVLSPAGGVRPAEVPYFAPCRYVSVSGGDSSAGLRVHSRRRGFGPRESRNDGKDTSPHVRKYPGLQKG